MKAEPSLLILRMLTAGLELNALFNTS